MKFIDMFCGMGTIRMGFEMAGHECVFAIEFDKHKRRIYEVIFGHEPEFGDITRVRGADLPNADCWCFGAPCQDFSIAGLRAGLDGERSGLVQEVFRLLREKEPANRPEWIVYENVKGMLSSNKGWDFAAIQAEMGECGYDVEWQLLNSKNFGVPQNRERVYTVGHLRARGERKVFPIGEDDATAIKLQRQCANTITARYGSAAGQGTYIGESQRHAQIKITRRINSSQDGFVVSPNGISKTLTAGHFNVPKVEVKQIGNVMPTATRSNPNQGRIYDPTGLAPCLNKMEGGGREPMIMQVGNLYRGNSQRGRVYSVEGLAPSLCSHSDTGAGLEPKIVEPCNRKSPELMEVTCKCGEVFITDSLSTVCPGCHSIQSASVTYLNQVAYGIYPNASPNYQHPPLKNLSRTLKADGGHPAGVIVSEATKKGYAEAYEGDSINLSVPNSKTRRGRVGKGLANTLDCACNQATLKNAQIRRLTPRECMRLQGVPDYITDKLIAAGISDTQMYRAAGDACTVNVVYAVASRMAKEKAPNQAATRLAASENNSI